MDTRHWWKKKRWIFAIAAVVISLSAWRSTAFWDALSPVTHKKELYRLAGVYKVDPLLLASIIRAESHFYPFARSSAGAVGLMQLMPDTATEMALELRLDYQDSKDLYRDEINLKLGTHYFSKLLKLFDGQLVLSLAAYNAGRAKVLGWKLDTYGRDQRDIIADIPITETREYVERVLDSYHTFKKVQIVKRMLGGQP